MQEWPLVFATTATGVWLALTLLWIVSVAIRNASIIDIFWGPGFAIIAVLTWLTTDGNPDRKWILGALTILWGLRLGAYLAWRNLGHGEDPRYVAMRERANAAGKNFSRTSYTRVYLLQGVIMWVVALPIQLGMMPATSDAIGFLGYAGIALFAIGFLFESIGDWQLARFKANPDNKGQVMDAGLWRYTRHPNYFGNACIWWGLFLIAAEATGAWISVISPILMTFLLLKVSGVALLEKSLAETKPQYRDYVRKTSAFFPRPPLA